MGCDFKFVSNPENIGEASGLISKLESYNFQCEAGPLENCEDWIRLKQLI